DPRLAGEIAAFYTELRDAAYAPFPGALEALARLRARAPALGLVTNGAAEMQRAKIERFGLAAWFDVIAIEGEVGAGKPDPRHFGHALAALDADPAATLMAGDNYQCDVMGALALGMHAVWIDRARRVAPPIAGAAPAAPPPRPHRTLASFVELVEALGACSGGAAHGRRGGRLAGGAAGRRGAAAARLRRPHRLGGRRAARALRPPAALEGDPARRVAAR